MELNDHDYLLYLAERLMHVPVVFGINQSDVSRLEEIAEKLGERNVDRS